MEDYGFEAVIVGARQRLIFDILRRVKPCVVLQVGCGIDVHGGRVSKAGLPVEQWLIVEPSERFFEQFFGNFPPGVTAGTRYPEKQLAGLGI